MGLTFEENLLSNDYELSTAKDGFPLIISCSLPAPKRCRCHPRFMEEDTEETSHLTQPLRTVRTDLDLESASQHVGSVQNQNTKNPFYFGLFLIKVIECGPE